MYQGLGETPIENATPLRATVLKRSTEESISFGLPGEGIPALNFGCGGMMIPKGGSLVRTESFSADGQSKKVLSVIFSARDLTGQSHYSHWRAPEAATEGVYGADGGYGHFSDLPQALRTMLLGLFDAEYDELVQSWGYAPRARELEAAHAPAERGGVLRELTVGHTTYKGVTFARELAVGDFLYPRTVFDGTELIETEPGNGSYPNSIQLRDMYGNRVPGILIPIAELGPNYFHQPGVSNLAAALQAKGLLRRIGTASGVPKIYFATDKLLELLDTPR